MKKGSIIIVDAGNTQVKVGHFLDGQLVDVKRFKSIDHAAFSSFMADLSFPPVFVSSVLNSADLDFFLGDLPHTLLLNLEMHFPVQIAYTSKETLGMDRLANACAAQSLQTVGPKVVIDLGTCIKFDFVDENGVYHGGSISPGLEMRLKALNHYTGKLPLIQVSEGSEAYLGKNSRESIRSGVIQGIQGELNHFISRYLQDYQGLTFFVTGGDAKFFDFPRKNNIFAVENLTLTGLYEIYLLNA